MRSPKRPKNASDKSRAEWFPYYAGYSAAFVEDALSAMHLPPKAAILDPWLGAGTTTAVAIAKGLRVLGYDLNPAMLVVARARTLGCDSGEEVLALHEEVCRQYKRHDHDLVALKPGEDGLGQWLTPTSALHFRTLERLVASTVGGGRRLSWRQVEQSPPPTATLYVALFRSLRTLIRQFRASNPAWTLIPGDANRIQARKASIAQVFRQEVHALTHGIQDGGVHRIRDRGRCSIRRASSLRLPLPSKSVDAVLSSPPYCTRLDYVRATLPELAVLGCPNGSWMRRLREQMIGTPTISSGALSPSRNWGPECARFLHQVRSHSSKASATYYHRHFCQYFDSIGRSLGEIDRVLKPGGSCILVVQDSHYKEVQIDLPRIFDQMGSRLGWRLIQRVDFPVTRSMRSINAASRKYSRRTVATEAVLRFSKPRRN